MRLDFLITAAETEAVNAKKAEANGNYSVAKQKYRLSAQKYREAAALCPERSLEFIGLAEQYETTVLPERRASLSDGEKSSKSEKPVTKKMQNVEENNPISKEEELAGALKELNSLIGLEAVKEKVNSWVKQIKVFNMRRERGMKVPQMSYHLVFKGNPGTGKTTVARLMGTIYHALGILDKGHLVEVDRGGLVAGYVGQTAIKTRKKIEEAYGGVLFIDEAYSLAKDGSNDFGQEATEILLKEMEDNRSNLVIIVAGYDKLMDKFISSNPGLRSRFKNFVHFPDYDDGQMLEIFKLFCADDYTLGNGVEDYLKAYFKEMYDNRGEEFGNARDVRNFYDKVITKQSERVYDKVIAKQSERVEGISNPADAEMRTILPEDLNVSD